MRTPPSTRTMGLPASFVRVALALPLLVTVAVGAWAQAAGANTAAVTNVDAGDLWVHAEDGEGTPVGMGCNTKFWSFHDVGGADAEFEWDNDTSGEISYNCEVVTAVALNTTGGTASCSPPTDSGPGEPSLTFAAKLDAGTTDVFLDVVPLLRTGVGEFYQRELGGGCVSERKGIYLSASALQLVNATFRGGYWYRISGQIHLAASCQPGGNGGSTLCGNTSQPTPAWDGGEANQTAQACGNFDIHPTGTNDVAGTITRARYQTSTTQFFCNVESGTGNATAFPVRPDGSSPPPQDGGDCSISNELVESRLDSASAWDEFNTDNGISGANVGERFRFTATVTYPAAQNVAYSITIRRLVGSLEDLPPGGLESAELTVVEILRPVLSPSGTPTVAHWTVPNVADDFGEPESVVSIFHFSFTCRVVGGDGQEIDWHSDDDPAGPAVPRDPGDPRDPVCQVPPCVPRDEIIDTDDTGLPPFGDFSRVLDCFEGTFEEMSVFGFDLPWVHFGNLPGDIMCAIDALLIPRSSDWREMLALMRRTWGTSSLGGVEDYITAPYDALTAFSSSAAAGSCSGVGVPIADAGEAHFFDACDPPVSTVAAVVKTGLGALVLAGAIIPAIRIVASSLGFHFSVGNTQTEEATA